MLSRLDEYPTLYGASVEMNASVVKALSESCAETHYDGWHLRFPRVIDNLQPSQYQQLLDAIGNFRLRHSYSNYRLEASPRHNQPRLSRFVSRFLGAASLEIDSLLESVGCMTLFSPEYDLGIEPDQDVTFSPSHTFLAPSCWSFSRLTTRSVDS